MPQPLFLTAAAVAAVTLGLAGSASAHGRNIPEHGGVLQVVADATVELVTKPAGVEVWVEEEGEEIASGTMDGKLIVAEGGAAKDIVLTPGAGNMWEAKGLTLGHGAHVTVLMTAKTGSDKVAANFTIK
jgi:hypothetical protein